MEREPVAPEGAEREYVILSMTRSAGEVPLPAELFPGTELERLQSYIAAAK